jgi:hypothetical protein
MAVVRVDFGTMRPTAALGLAAGIGLNVLWGPGRAGHVGLPCPLRTITGIPCPLCGMTTSVTATLRGDLSAAVAANPAGILVAVLAVIVLAGVLQRRALTLPRWSAYAGLAVLWVFELVRFRII